MKYAIISDIHSDYNSFLKILSDIKQKGINKIISLGDNIGYGNFPDAIISEMIKRKTISVMGNHEKAIFDKDEYNAMSQDARQAFDENLKYLSETHLDFIKSFPIVHIENNIRFVHAMPPNSNTVYINRLTNKEILSQSQLFKEKFSFCGHTHQSGIYEIENNSLSRNSKVKYGGEHRLAPNKRYIFNVGSVSFQRIDKNNNRHEYAIFDLGKATVEFIIIP